MSAEFKLTAKQVVLLRETARGQKQIGDRNSDAIALTTLSLAEWRLQRVHGFLVTGIEITEKGRELLKKLNPF